MDRIALFSEDGRQIARAKTVDLGQPVQITFSVTSPQWPVDVTHYGTWGEADVIPALSTLPDPVRYFEPGEYVLTVIPPAA